MSCRELSSLLSLRASGALPPADEARLAAHLEACQACRAESARLEELVSLLRLPGADPAEERGAAFLPVRTLAAARAARAPHRLGWAAAGAAAALAVSLGVGAGLRASRPPPQPELATAETSAWQEPDLEELWEWSGPLALDSEDSP